MKPRLAIAKAYIKYKELIKEKEKIIKEKKVEDKELVQALTTRKVEYDASLDISENRDSLAVFIRPNLRNHIEFDKEVWQIILELPLTLLWDMLRNNLVSANFSENQVELIRRKNEALAAEKYLEEYEKT